MKLFVWDFHGVLEKGTEKFVLETSNFVLGKLGFKERFTQEEINSLYGKKWYEYFRYLLPKLKKSELLFLQESCFAYQRDNPSVMEKHLVPNDYAHEVLSKIGLKNQQILISNSNQEAIELFLKIAGLAKYFGNSVFGIDQHSFEKTTKKEKFENFLENSRCEYQQIISIGDSEGDMNLYQGENFVRYLYSHPGKNKRKVKADYYISDLREVLKEL